MDDTRQENAATPPEPTPDCWSDLVFNDGGSVDEQWSGPEQLHQDRPDESPAGGDQSLFDKLQDILGNGQTKYDFRQKAREAKSTFTRTWLDDDKTGLYDPAEEQRKLRQRPKRAKPLLKAGFKPWNLSESDEESDAPIEPMQEELPRVSVILRFESEVGRAAFQKHVNGLPAKSEASDELFGERRLRRRESGVRLSHAFRDGPTKTKKLPDGLPEDLTGHPIARGCWECFAIGIRCPLLDDPRAWPCTTCHDDGNECELITPPIYKRTCEHCKSKRLGCSYTYTLDHDGPCEECSRTGWSCVAGPAKETIRERISYDRDWENDPWQAPKTPKVKKLPSCRRCRERGQSCSFSAGDKSEMCTACDMAGQTCLPEFGKAQSSRKRTRAQISSKTAAAEETDEEATKAPNVLGHAADDTGHILIVESSDKQAAEAPVAPEQTQTQIYISSESSDSDSDIPPPPKKPKTRTQPRTQAKAKKEGILETITTKFAHPIAFNHHGDEPCHFCTDPRFAMFGLGAVDVEVIDWHDGRGLQETGGGHRGQGIERTRMCVGCTTMRTLVVLCEGHEFSPLEGKQCAIVINV